MTLVVVGAMVVLLATGIAPPAVAGLLAAGAIVLTRVLTIEQAYRGIQWTTVILVAGMLPLSTAMTQTGAAKQLADGLVDVVGDLGPRALLLGLVLLVFVLGQLISNMATALIVIPIAVSAAAELDVSAKPVLMAVASQPRPRSSRRSRRRRTSWSWSRAATGSATTGSSGCPCSSSSGSSRCCSSRSSGRSDVRRSAENGAVMRLCATVVAVLAALVAVPAAAASYADEQALAERFAPIVRLVEQQDVCSYGEPFIPTDIDLLLGEETVALRGPWNVTDLVKIAPTADDLVKRFEYHLDFPGNALNPGCDYNRWAQRLTRGSEPVVYAHVVGEDGFPGKVWRSSTGSSIPSTTSTTRTRATGR